MLEILIRSIFVMVGYRLCSSRRLIPNKNDVRLIFTPSCMLMSYLCYLCLFVYSDVQQILTMTIWRMSYKRQELANLSRAHVFTLGFWWGPCCSYLSFSVFCYAFVFLLLSSCVLCGLGWKRSTSNLSTLVVCCVNNLFLNIL
jgi:hypothetical protein